MAWTLEQSASDIETTTLGADVTPTLAASPTAGRLLVMVVGMRSATDGTIDPSTTVISGITGWTQIVSQQGGDLGLGIWAKVAQAGDGTTVTLDLPGTTAKAAAWLGEFSGNAASATLPDDSSGSSVAAASTVALGPVTATVAGSLVVGGVCIQGGATDIVWESLTEVFGADTTSSSGSRTWTGVAWGELTGSITEDPIWTGASVAAGGIAVFEPAVSGVFGKLIDLDGRRIVTIRG